MHNIIDKDGIRLQQTRRPILYSTVTLSAQTLQSVKSHSGYKALTVDYKNTTAHLPMLGLIEFHSVPTIINTKVHESIISTRSVQ